MAVSFRQISTAKPNSYDATGKILIEEIMNALTDAISRSGTSPNTMLADLDMGGNSILNMEGESTSSGAASDVTFTATDDITSTDVQSAIEEVDGVLTTHVADTGNPHSVTASQVGLGNVDNTADADKPISDAEQTAFDLLAPLDSPAFTTDLSMDGYRVLTTDNLVSSNSSTLTFDSDTITITGKDSSGTYTNVGAGSTILLMVMEEVTPVFGTVSAGGTSSVEITISKTDSDYYVSAFATYAGTSDIPDVFFSATIPDDTTDTVAVVAYNPTTADITLDDDLVLTVRMLKW